MTFLPTLPGRHPCDREILRLAIPALGALAAEPLYILTDTAVVGHLGTPQLGGLAVAGTILTTAFSGGLLAALAVATAVASRLGTVSLGAHQVAFQLWSFLALSLDSIAIAAQAMVGRLLGAGDAAGARTASRRMVEWGLLAGLALGGLVAMLRPLLAPLFSDDPAVIHLTRQVLWVVAVLQPLNAVVFVLDGVLIGAGDLRFLAGAMMVAFGLFLPAAVLAGTVGGTLLWLWGAITLLMVARLAGVAWRFAGSSWAVTGA